MSTVVASYTPVCRSPVLPASTRTRAGRFSWRPAVAFPTSVAAKCRRPLSVTCALQRPAFSIPPTALLCPVPPPDVKERWNIKEDEEQVKLWLQVPGLSEKDIEITADEDMLEIKGAKVDDGEAIAFIFHVRLLMTKEYDDKSITAELKAGMLEVTVGKSKKRSPPRKIKLGLQSPAHGASTSPNETVGSSPNQTQGAAPKD